MIVYHRTPAPQQILDHGFKDGTGTYGTDAEHVGTWVTPDPDLVEGADGWTILQLEVPESDLLEFEWVEEGKTYREFCVPARVLNLYGRPTIHEDDYKGFTEQEVCRKISGLNTTGRHDQAKALEVHLAFLQRHGLLASELSD